MEECHKPYDFKNWRMALKRSLWLLWWGNTTEGQSQNKPVRRWLQLPRWEVIMAWTRAAVVRSWIYFEGRVNRGVSDKLDTHYQKERLRMVPRYLAWQPEDQSVIYLGEEGCRRGRLDRKITNALLDTLSLTCSSDNHRKVSSRLEVIQTSLEISGESESSAWKGRLSREYRQNRGGVRGLLLSPGALRLLVVKRNSH